LTSKKPTARALAPLLRQRIAAGEAADRQRPCVARRFPREHAANLERAARLWRRLVDSVSSMLAISVVRITSRCEAIGFSTRMGARRRVGCEQRLGRRDKRV
jgi:hypothetical protein